jgi:hypothetical protein
MTITPLSTSYLDGSVFSASDINATNTAVNANTAIRSLIAAKGDLLSGSADDTLVKTTVGANNTVLYADSGQSGGVFWGTITSAMITDGTITGTDIASGTITSANIVDGTITTTDISASAAISYTKLAGVYNNAGSTNPKITISTSSGSGQAGALGDVWFQY